MKKLMPILLCIGLTYSADARQKVSTRDVLIDTTTNYVYQIITTEDDMQETVDLFDEAIYSNSTKWIANASNITVNAEAIEGTISNTTVNADAIASNVTDIIAVNLALAGFNVCNTNTTITLDAVNYDTLDKVYSTVTNYDYVVNGVELTYLFEGGTYTFDDSLYFEKLAPGGPGKVIMKGEWTNASAPDTIFQFIGSSTGGIRLSTETSNEMIIGGGFQIEGTGSVVTNMALRGVSVDDGAVLNVYAPIVISKFSSACVVSRNLGLLHMFAKLYDTGAAESFYLYSGQGFSTNAVTTDGLLAQDIGQIVVSAPSVTNTAIYFLGGTNYPFSYMVQATYGSEIYARGCTIDRTGTTNETAYALKSSFFSTIKADDITDSTEGTDPYEGIIIN